jgi:hypothetical protein
MSNATRELREMQLSAPVTAWLESQGLTVYAEIPYHGRCVDHAGLSEDRVVIVELKQCLSRTVMLQLGSGTTITPWCYAAVASKPSKASLDLFARCGLGVLSVRDGAVKVLLEPVDRGYVFKPHVAGFRERCAEMGPGGVAGVPTLRGQGPAQTVYDRVCAYRSGRAGATWREIYEAVGNHYCSPSSMRGAMEFVEFRRRQQAKQESVLPPAGQGVDAPP